MSSLNTDLAATHSAGELTEQVITVVRSAMPGLGNAMIDLDSSLREMGFDSVDLIELSVRLEDTFDLVLAHGGGRRVNTVSDVLALVIESKTAAGAEESNS